LVSTFDPFNLSKHNQERISLKDPLHVSKIIKTSPAADNTISTPENQGLSNVWEARLLVIVAAALYGSNFTCVKLLNDQVPVGISTTLRFLLATVATLPWLMAPPDPPKTDKQVTTGLTSASWLPQGTAMAATLAGLEVGAYNSIGYISQAVGLETTDASKSAFVCSLAVVTVPTLDTFAGKNMKPREVVGATLAVLGVAFLELGGADALQSFGTGDLITLMQPIFFGLGFWRMERAMHQHPQEAKRLTAAQILAVFLSSAVYTQFLSDENVVVSQMMGWTSDPNILFGLFWTGCITTALTLYMETLALKTLSAAETTMLFSTEPLWAAAVASVVAGEQLGLGAGVGAALILSGCLYSNMGYPLNLPKGGAPPTTSGNESGTKKSNRLPKALLGTGFTVATPATAAAAIGKMAGDLADSPVHVHKTLGDL